MLRTLLLAASATALTVAASAQSPQVAPRPERMPSALKHAGIYHVQSGTWTRHTGQTANVGPDIVYSNTALSGYFTSFGGAGGDFSGAQNFDEGSLPGTLNTNVFTTPPNRDEYRINCVQIAYCDNGAPASSGWTLNFFSNHTPCTFNPAMPDATITTTGLPANGGCWVVDLDLTGMEFCLQAEGDGVFDDDPNLDSFGWSFQYAGSDGANGNTAGFLVTGNPEVTDPTWAGGLPRDGSNTYFGTTNCVDVGTGFLTRDNWWLEDPAGMASNCYFFGGYTNTTNSCVGPLNKEWASFYLQLSADTGPCNPSGSFGTIYCTSNPNSSGVNGSIELTGSRVAADDDCTIRAFNLPQNAFGFFIVSETQGFVMNPSGSQGNICVLGAIGRFVGPGQVMNSLTTGEISLSTTGANPLWSLTATPSPTGPRMSVMGTTDNFQLWHRDTVGGMATSNFSDAISHTWL